MLELIISAALHGASLVADPETYARVGQWQINYDKDACHLTAAFNNGDRTIRARLSRYQPGDGFGLMLLGRDWYTTDNRANISIDFGFGPIKAEGSLGTLGKDRILLIPTVSVTGPAAGAMPVADRETAATGMTLRVNTARPFRIEAGGMAKPMAAMRACTADLVRSWGYDPDEQEKLSRKLRGTTGPAAWLRSEDFPPEAVRKGANGIIQFRLDVDPTGTPVACRVLDRTDPDLFADATCNAIMKRARFDPALDAHGAPTKSFLVSKVLWRGS